MYRGLGSKRVKRLYKVFGTGYLCVSNSTKYTVYTFKLKSAEECVILIFRKII